MELSYYRKVCLFMGKTSHTRAMTKGRQCIRSKLQKYKIMNMTSFQGDHYLTYLQIYTKPWDIWFTMSAMRVIHATAVGLKVKKKKVKLHQNCIMYVQKWSPKNHQEEESIGLKLLEKRPNAPGQFDSYIAWIGDVSKITKFTQMIGWNLSRKSLPYSQCTDMTANVCLQVAQRSRPPDSVSRSCVNKKGYFRRIMTFYTKKYNKEYTKSI